MARTSAKKRKRSGKAQARRGRGSKIFLIATLVGVVGLAMFAFMAYLAIRGYLHSEKFRALVGDQTSQALDAEGEFEAFKWNGNSMYTNSFAANGTEDAFFSRLKAHEIRAKVSLGGVARGVWEIPSVQITKFDFVLSDDRLTSPSAPADSDEDESHDSGGGGMFSGIIPSEVEIGEVKIKETNFDVDMPLLRAKARGIGVTVSPTSATDGYAIVGRSGTLTADGYPEFAVDSFNLRTGDENVTLTHAALRFFRSARAQISGEASLSTPPRMLFNGVLSGLDLADVLAADWVQKFKGIVNGKFKLQSDPVRSGELVTSGTLSLKSGSLEAMPVLRRIDTLAGTTRFRKLNFSNVEVEFEKRPGELELGEVLFESAGLACLKGWMLRSVDGAPEGIYMLGISPDMVKWMPIGRKQVVEQVFKLQRASAFAEVFPRAAADEISLPPEGYRWMVARIDPDSPDPYTADVRNQFIEAGGLAIWAELQGMPERVVNAAADVAKIASDQGLDVLAMLATEGFGSTSRQLTEGMVEKLGDTLEIEDLFKEGTAIPKAIIDSGFDIINDLNPLAPRK